jgi:hypothetical protein
MAGGTYAADARGEGRHFGKRAAFAEFLKAAKLGDVKVGILHDTLIVELDGDLAVPFNASNTFNHDALHASNS